MDNNSINIKSATIPKTIKEIKEFLVLIKSVGKLTANRIVYRGGLQTLAIIYKGISLGKIKGVGPKKGMAIYIAVRELLNKEVKKV
jgi:hypothetical protein